ncbi:hypothetical protein BHWA1_01103 [Brachyspira hyodysenteriae WA1]|uniref:Uncharacterized protein n=1 Tax=Brachyspira hyodysenteriae (strain ATCC 49526 / WA1) TaxID=565034 RepID=A0A3B6VHY0_BRAHW|nr:hypothetical protein BHWA1_01103 [Brachyspira hyodysenteriae WA1]
MNILKNINTLTLYLNTKINKNKSCVEKIFKLNKTWAGAEISNYAYKNNYNFIV